MSADQAERVSYVAPTADSSASLMIPTRPSSSTSEESLSRETSDNSGKSYTTSLWKDRLQGKLFGRDVERERLAALVNEFGAGSTPGLLLITGPSGSGTTSLAKTLKRPIEAMGGYFITGKFDRLQRPSPYPGLVAAIFELASLVLQRGDKAVECVRYAIEQAVGDEAYVLTRVIPALESIIGTQESETKAPRTDDSLQRFVFVFQNFLRAVCTPTQPILLMFDDIHWADPCSLDMFGSIACDHANRGLMLVATCKEKVSGRSYLASKLRELEDLASIEITNVSISNFDVPATRHMLQAALGSDSGDVEALAKLVHAQTGGTIVEMLAFLDWLEDSDILKFEASHWSWNMADIVVALDVDRPFDYIAERLKNQRPSLLYALKVASCLGPLLHPRVLGLVVGDQVDAILEQAVSQGLLEREESQRLYMFAHDRIQAAAYALIPEEEREQFHLGLGRRLWRGFDSIELDRFIFDLLSQMNIARDRITKERERCALARLCLHAGTKAARASTFRTSLVYLQLGISLLEPRSWRDEYDLTLALYTAAAEMTMSASDMDGLDELVNEVLANAKSFRDKVPVYSTRIYGFGATQRQQVALETGIMVLEGLGERFPRRFCKVHLALEMRKVKKLLRGKSDEQLMRMPIIVNRDKLACLQIMHLLHLSALLVRPTLIPFLSLRMIRLTLEYGACVFTSAAFAQYGVFLLNTGDVDAAYRYAKVGRAFVDMFKAREYLPKVSIMYYGLILPWKRPLEEVLEPLLEGYRVGLQIGDFEGACLCANMYCLNALACSVPLPLVDRQWEAFQDQMVFRNQKSHFVMAIPRIQTMHQMMGLFEDPLSAKGDLVDVEEMARTALEQGRITYAVLIGLNRMIHAYILNDYDLAEEMAPQLRELWRMAPTFERINTVFFGALVALQLARMGRSKRKNLRTANQFLKRIRRLATFAPHNCLDKRFLIEAEQQSVQGNNAKAYEKYICALATAKESRFIFIVALVHERLARHLINLGESEQARTCFNEACRYYTEWGGLAKVNRLRVEMDSLYAKGRPSRTSNLAHAT